MRRATKGLVVVYNGRTIYQKTDQEKRNEYCQIIFFVLMTSIFVAIKISCFIMIFKFAFQKEDNLFGFNVEMFSFTKTFWSVQYPSTNYTMANNTSNNITTP